MEGDKGMKVQTPKYKGRFIKKKNLEKKLNLIARISEAKKGRLERAEAEAEQTVPQLIEESQESNENLPDNALLTGSRIIDIKVFAESLKCCRCKQPLSVQQTQSEKRFGLYSVFNILCLRCKIITEVHTGTVQVEGAKRPIPDINKQAVLGAISAGVSCGSLNKFLTSLEIPNLSRTLFKRYQDEVNSAKEDASKENSEVLDEKVDS